MRTRSGHARTVPVALAPPVAVVAALGPLAGAALADRPVNAGSSVAVAPGCLTRPRLPASQRSSAMAGAGSRGAGARVAAVLLAVGALAVVLLLLFLVQPGAIETTLTPTPMPQSAPVAP
jgi:hypothetical protein